jgi:hypothetical protein
MKKVAKPQRSATKALKARGIRPGKVTKATPKGQATGGWSPFAPPTGRMDIADDVEYDAVDRKGRWYTHKPKG